MRFETKIEGDITQQKEITIKDIGVQKSDLEKLEFGKEKLVTLKPHFKNYDLIIAINLLDRLYDPELFLRDIAKKTQ